MAKELRRLRWKEPELERRAKSHGGKVELAAKRGGRR